MEHKHQNIYLVGLMGAGKTTIGRGLAKKFGWRFIDSDHEIEARTGVSIPTIFEIEGEEGFRRREAQVIEELSKLSNIVMATGGGVVLAPMNRECLKRNGVVVFLDVPPVQLYERTRNDRNRPLLQVADPLARLKSLHAERTPYYREVADIIIEGGRCNAGMLATQLQKEFGIPCNP